MKPSSIVCLGHALAACLVLPASGQTTPSTETSPGPGQVGQSLRVTEIIGSPIKDLRGEKIGTVKDLALDLQNGRIVEIVVARGGLAGTVQTFVAVPPRSLNVETGGKTLCLNLDTEKLDGAPGVDLAHWSQAMKRSRVEEVYQYFGATPYFAAPDLPAKNASNPVTQTLNEAERAGQLIHLSTLNHQAQILGSVEDVIVDLPAARVVEVIIASGHFLGIKDELSAVPPQALEFNSDRDTLTLNSASDALANGPHFPAGAWPRIDGEQAGKVYRAYDVAPYFVAGGGAGTTQNAGESDGDIEAILNQVANKSDTIINSRICADIQSAHGLSVDARNVKITTTQGRVTLTGTAANRGERRRLGRIAARYAIAGSVDNQVEIKSAIVSAIITPQ